MEKFEKNLLLLVVFFLGLGLVQVYSSSYIFANQSYGDGLYFFKKQCFFTFLGFFILMFFIFVSWDWVEKKGVYWFGGLTSFGLLLSVIPLTSAKVGGARRWIELAFTDLRFEPGELLKITLPLILAHLIAKYFKFKEISKNDFLKLNFSHFIDSDQKTDLDKKTKTLQTLGLQDQKDFKVKYKPKSIKKNLFQFPFKGLDFMLIFFLFSFFFFLLLQPDFGTFILCLLTLFAMLFAFGMKWSRTLLLFLFSLPLFYFLILKVPYRYNRILSFLNPWEDPSNRGFQVIQSLVTIHSGGFFGKGLGLGQGKLFFLPEAHTDFTLAVLSEEMGFIGFLIVVVLYAYVFLLGFKIAMRSQTIFSKAFCFGLTFVLALSVTTHMGVVLGLLPTKGLALPFLSYGGSSLTTTCISMGLLLNASRIRKPEKKRIFFPIS